MSKKIFISHSSKDQAIIKTFIDDLLLGALGIQINEIFCTSIDGTKIESGEDWRDEIRENLIGARVSFLFISPNYKESEICLNEMGAVWVSDSHIIPLIIEPINYSTVGVIMEPKQVEKILDEKCLDRIKDKLIKELNLSAHEMKSDRWTSKKYEFLQKAKTHIDKNTFPIPLKRKEFDNVIAERDSIKKSLISLTQEKIQLDNIIEQLKKEKGLPAYKKVLKKEGKISQEEEFESLSVDVKKLLKDIGGPIIRGAIFASYTGKNIRFNYSNDFEDVSEAIANTVLEEDSYKVIWDVNPRMKKLNIALKELKEFISSISEETFYNDFEENYKVALDINNVDFWRTVFEVSIRFGS